MKATTVTIPTTSIPNGAIVETTLGSIDIPYFLVLLGVSASGDPASIRKRGKATKTSGGLEAGWFGVDAPLVFQGLCHFAEGHVGLRRLDEDGD